jgi:transcriptional regulator with XRE-family HTH domain
MGDHQRPPLTLGQYLDASRQQARLSLRGLEQASGIPRSTLNRLLKDEVEFPSAATLMRLSKVLDLKPADVFAHAGITSPPTSSDLETLLRDEYGLSDQAIGKIHDIIATDQKGDRP